jgi:putative drug exporter of the RND superfamily
MFERIAGWSYRHRWTAVVLWLAVLAGLAVTAQGVGPAYRNDFALPGTQSQQALDVLRAQAPVQAGATAQIVVQDGAGLASSATRDRVEAMLDQIRGLPHVADVRSPYAGASAISADGTIGYAIVTFDAEPQELPAPDVRAVVETARAADGDGLRVEVGGDPVRAVEEDEGGPSEGVGLLAALVILVLLFGSVLAASLPIVIAIFAVGTAISAIMLASHAAIVADYTTPLMVLVGLGVGIDYALLVFSRYRTELIDGRDREAATRRALDTAGRTVFFAGCTVIIALMGLVALGLGSLQGIALAVALTVAVTMVAALTLLPALLAILGARIERAVRRRAQRRAGPGHQWGRWAEFVRRYRWPAALVPVLALLALAAPALDMRLGFADAGSGSPARTSRQAYDLLAEGFGPGFNGPLIVVVEGDSAAAEQARQTLAATPGVAAAIPASGNGDVTTVVVVPTAKPQDEQTHDLVQRLRSDVLPPVARATGSTILVGGAVAAAEDFATAVSDRLPLFVGVVVGASMLVLMVVFRSLLIPLKAAVLNLLSVGAAMGVITLVFQHGAFGVPPGPIEAFVPVLIFAIVFGLSMDYEVFLLARMDEQWRRTRDPADAIRHGLATTGSVVTAAAAIMVVVFGAFVLSGDRMLASFGLGLAVAVLLDATVIRCLVLPALMNLLGRGAWWLPAWLGRITPRMALERSES